MLVAVKEENADIVIELLDAGADIEAADCVSVRQSDLPSKPETRNFHMKTFESKLNQTVALESRVLTVFDFR